MSERASRIVGQLVRSVEAEIEAGVKEFVASGKFKVHGLSVDQVAALKARFETDVAIDPATLPPEAIIRVKDLD